MTLKIKNIQTFKVNKKKQNKTKQKNKQKKTQFVQSCSVAFFLTCSKL